MAVTVKAGRRVKVWVGMRGVDGNGDWVVPVAVADAVRRVDAGVILPLVGVAVNVLAAVAVAVAVACRVLVGASVGVSIVALIVGRAVAVAVAVAGTG